MTIENSTVHRWAVFRYFQTNPKMFPSWNYILYVPWKSPTLSLSHWRMIPETTKQTHQSITKQLKGDTTSSSQPALTKGTLRRPWLRRCEVNPGTWPSLDTLQTMSWSVKWWLFENQLCLQLIVVYFQIKGQMYSSYGGKRTNWLISRPS